MSFSGVVLYGDIKRPKLMSFMYGVNYLMLTVLCCIIGFVAAEAFGDCAIV